MSFRLLVVDDEELIRRPLLRALKGYGFEVAEAGDGEEAAGLIRDSGQPFDLLVTDVVMPRMNGWDLADLTMSLSPGTRILVISAYAADPPRQALHALPYLQKPFDLEVFLTTVRQLLHSPTPPKSFPAVGT